MDNTPEHKAFLLLLAVVTVGFFWILLPFYGAVFWAVILAIVFQPLQRTFERRLGPRTNLSALLSVLVCVVLAIIPMALILGALLNEGAKILQRIQSGQFATANILDTLEAVLPDWAQRLLDRAGAGDFDALLDRLVSAAQQAGQLLAAQALTFGQNTLRFIASIGIMLYVLFFLFRDGRSIGRNIGAAMPLSDRYNRQLLAKFAAVVRATVKGNIVIAAIQGTIGGVTFWLLGIDGALLWGALMILLSLLPAVGAALVWVPVAIYLFTTGATGKAIVLVVVGGGVIGLVDNLLRPILVGKDTRLPDYVILVSTLGGLSVFGINGFVIGPLIAALFVAAWTIFRDERDAARARDRLVRTTPAATTPAAPPGARRR